MKKIFLIAILLFNYSLVNAQTLRLGEASKHGQHNVLKTGYSVVSINSEAIVMYASIWRSDIYDKNNKVTLSVKTFDPNTLNLKNEISIELEDILPKGECFINITSFDNKPYTVVAKLNSEQTHYDFYLRQLNLTAPYFGKFEKKISSIHKKTDSYFRDYAIHEESKNELFEGYYYGSKESKKANYTYNVSIYNRETKIWKDYSVVSSINTSLGKSFNVSNDGSFGFIATNKNSEEQTSVSFFSNFNNESIIEKQLSTENWKEIKLINNSDSDFLIMGYGDLRKRAGYHSTNKIFTQLVDSDGFGDRKTYDLPIEFITELWEEGPNKKALNEINEFGLGIKHSKTLNTEINTNYVVFEAYHFGHELNDPVELNKSVSNSNIVVMHFDDEGELLWKKNVFTNTYYGGLIKRKFQYNYYCRNNKLYLLYFEMCGGQQENCKYRTVLVSIDDEGNEKVEFESFYSKLGDFFIDVKLSFEFGINSFFIYGTDNIRERIGVLTIEE
jgi:hypothetical protein